METMPRQAINLGERGPHLLLVNLGLGQDKRGPLGYAETTYLMPDGSRYPTSLAGFALWKWLDATGRSPVAVVFACTESAWNQKQEALRKHAAELGLEPSKISPPVILGLPQTLEDVWAMIEPMESRLRAYHDAAGPVLHLDLTHAFRAIPLAHLLIALYFQERGLATVGVCGYGVFQEGQTETPYIDLSHLLHLARWAQAVRSFRERFDTTGLAGLLEQYEREARHAVVQSGMVPPPEVRRLISAARLAGPYFAAGLPLELGVHVGQTLGHTTRESLEKAATKLVTAQQSLVLELFDALHPLTPGQVAKKSAKASLVLDKQELARQVRLLKLWLQAGLPERALLVLREVVINRLLLAANPESWLEHGIREQAETVLNDVFRPEEPPLPSSPELKVLRSLWREITNRRNPLAHAGMCKSEVDVGQLSEAVEELVEKLEALLELDEPWQELARQLSTSGEGKA